MSLVDYLNQCAAFSINSCTKLMIKRWRINKYLFIYISLFVEEIVNFVFSSHQVVALLCPD
jgi:hypothetical protein